MRRAGRCGSVVAQITDQEGNTAFENKQQQSGKFGFTTAVAGEYKFCLSDVWFGGGEGGGRRVRRARERASEQRNA